MLASGTMRAFWSAAVVATVLFAAAVAPSATPDDFLIKDAQDVVDVCTVPESDAMYAASIGFCHGYIVGAIQYHFALHSRHPKKRPPFCLPEPRPTRSQSIAGFVAWVQANPKYQTEPAVEALVKYLVEKYPCPK